MNLASAILQRPKLGVKRLKAAPIRHSTFGFRHFPAPLSPQTPSHPVPAPRPGPARPRPLKSNFLAAAAKRRAIVEFWLSPYESLPFDGVAASHYADIRHHLESKGQVIGPNDLKIAAICRTNGLTLATGNLSEFRRVPDLKL
jgi:hypothetical protein